MYQQEHQRGKCQRNQRHREKSPCDQSHQDKSQRDQPYQRNQRHHINSEFSKIVDF